MKGKGFTAMPQRQGGWIQIAALALSAVGTALSFSSSRRAERAARDQGQREAELEQKVTDERLRQLEREERALKGQSLARYAGSNVVLGSTGSMQSLQNQSLTGSPAIVIAEQAAEFARERRITEEVGATKVQQSLSNARNVAAQYRVTGYANLASNVGDIFQQIYNIRNPP